MPLCLGASGVGPAGEPDPVGVVPAGGERLLAVDDVLVAVSHGAGAEAGQVGAGARLAVADREVQLPGEDLGEEGLLLLLGAELHERRADGVQRDERERDTGAVRLVVEEVLLHRGAALPAVRGGPPDAEPAVLAELAHELAVRLATRLAAGQLAASLRRHQRREVAAQLGLEGPLLGRQVDVHASLFLAGRGTVPSPASELQHVAVLTEGGRRGRRHRRGRDQRDDDEGAQPARAAPPRGDRRRRAGLPRGGRGDRPQPHRHGDGPGTRGRGALPRGLGAGVRGAAGRAAVPDDELRAGRRGRVRAHGAARRVGPPAHRDHRPRLGEPRWRRRGRPPRRAGVRLRELVRGHPLPGRAVRAPAARAEHGDLRAGVAPRRADVAPRRSPPPRRDGEALLRRRERVPDDRVGARRRALRAAAHAAGPRPRTASCSRAPPCPGRSRSSAATCSPPPSPVPRSSAARTSTSGSRTSPARRTPTNEELVRQAVALCGDVGRPVAGCDEAATILGLPRPRPDNVPHAA